MTTVVSTTQTQTIGGVSGPEIPIEPPNGLGTSGTDAWETVREIGGDIGYASVFATVVSSIQLVLSVGTGNERGELDDILLSSIRK